MSYSTMPAYVPKDAQVYFHRVREEGPKKIGDIAAMYNVSATHLINDTATIQPKAGDIVVIDLKAGKISVQ